MKYIRTENGIYEVTATAETNKIYEYGNCYQIYDHNNCIRKDILIKEIIKQADTIEELCDEFVDEEQHYIIQNKNLLKDIPNKSELKKHKIYGAIWTSKGLIYVAKMNSEGKLVLI